MRRIAALALCISGLLLFGCAQDKVQAEELTPPFWVAEDAESGNRLYLLGSMHVGRQGAYYPEYVVQAYNDSEVIAVELDISAPDSVVKQGMEHLLCEDGMSASEHFGDEYAQVVDYLDSIGSYADSLNRYVPYVWASNISVLAAQECGLYSEYGTEHYFVSRAKSDGKQIVEIESYDEQYRMMSEIPMSVQVYSVTSSVGEAKYAELMEDTQSLYDAWSAFDADALEQLNATVYDNIPQDINEDYSVFMDKMYFSRQQKMADTAADLLQSEETSFMLVGAAHFYIEQDILTLLEAQGYLITEIRPETASEAA